jgi:hypothetical protein
MNKLVNMRESIFPCTFIFVLSLTSAFGQAPPDFSALCKKQMKSLSAFAGHWEGEATYKRGPGSPETIHQEEEVSFRIDSTLLVIEGVGTRPTGKEVVFNALGIINFNPQLQSFSFRSYLKDGRATEAYFKIIEENKFEWGFEIPGGTNKVRYSIMLDADGSTWTEFGEFSGDGTTWMKFIELHLKKG